MQTTLSPSSTTQRQATRCGIGAIKLHQFQRQQLIARYSHKAPSLATAAQVLAEARAERKRQLLLREAAAATGALAALALGGVMITPTGAAIINWLLQVAA